MTEKPSHHEKRSSLHVDQHKTKFCNGWFFSRIGSKRLTLKRIETRATEKKIAG